ncbi:MAG TPA: hypothetical protein DCP08_04060 [Chloroflexi bacterium]|nr:hypothetical protein [Chloroflexota bacterium]
MDIEDYFSERGWSVTYTTSIPPREAEVFQTDDLPLSSATRDYLQSRFSKGLYRHQKEAIRHFVAGNNVCMTTSAASGKSVPFYVAGLELLNRNPECRIVAMYPLKALGREQQERWKEALGLIGLGDRVGRIDGQVPMALRAEIVRQSNVLIATPDIVHAWLLPSVSNRSVQKFLQNLSLIIVDEIHTYSGVFGSNSAFLFRRMQHIMNLLGARPQYICASATISKPISHLHELFGVEFSLVGEEFDTSPKHRVEIELVVPPRSSAFLSEVSELLYNVASRTSHNFLAFVDSRKQTEHITAIIDRWRGKGGESEKERAQEAAEFDHLQRLDVLPFRAGYEAQDRDAIQERLTRGSLRGVVSTSALELGIDIPHLTLGVLIGVPRSATSLHQRIGRIGRRTEGKVVVINTGHVYDELVFRKPEEFLNRPMADCALYLENPRIQYINALCLARQGGEHDQACAAIGIQERSEFSSTVAWPNGFIELCNRERRGEIGPDLQSMKMEAGEDPNHTFPLRDVESQFRVQWKQGPLLEPKGSLSFSQVMREAYPGAVYYYTTIPYRVYLTSLHSKNILVRREKRYTTRPVRLPTQVFPNLTTGNVHRAVRHGELAVIECNLQIRESLLGFKERRGSKEQNYVYPIDMALTNVRYTKPRFTRNYFTTGVVLSHPVLNRERVDVRTIASLLYEAFLILIPFERRDVNFAADKYRVQRGPVNEGDRFVCIYDQTYGSLRLSGRILQGDVLQKTFDRLVDLAEHDETVELNCETLEAIDAMKLSLLETMEDIFFAEIELPPPPGEFERVIMPGSKGLYIRGGNEELLIEGVFFSPADNALRYRVKSEGEIGLDDSNLERTVPIDALVEIPGESEMGLYYYDTGEIKPVT